MAKTYGMIFDKGWIAFQRHNSGWILFIWNFRIEWDKSREGYWIDEREDR